MIRRLITALAILSAAGGCASPGMPPGGPIDTEGPRIIAIAPDSGRVGVKPPEVVFKFDEVVSERPAGAPSLAGLFLISPRDGGPKVDWHRSEVSVKPRRGWRSNTAYTITMLPGITDLRGNVRNTGKVTIFSTGAEIPTSRVAGIVFNWITGGVAQKGLIEARPVTDTTLVYVAATDSTGTFSFPNLPPGKYRLRGLIDDNNNQGLDPREAWDTTTVSLTDSARVELVAFAHDSVAPRLSDVVMRDSATLELLFDRAIDPNQRFTPASVDIKRSDSTVIAVSAVESGGGARDTSVVRAGPVPSRPVRRRVSSPSSACPSDKQQSCECGQSESAASTALQRRRRKQQPLILILRRRHQQRHLRLRHHQEVKHPRHRHRRHHRRPASAFHERRSAAEFAERERSARDD